jgi:AcrR family transcriptional regulator
MARPRSAGFEDQRDVILAAAAQLFATQGFAATTMNGVAAACGVSKATLYHYVRDKHDLLAQVSRSHVQRLEALVDEVQARGLPAAERLPALITAFMRVYAKAQHEHRVLTADVQFLEAAPQREVLDAQRRVVAAFEDAIHALRPALRQAQLGTPVAMLLFGMMNWTFTWLHAQGPLTHESVARLVTELFLGGLLAVQAASAGAGTATGAAAGSPAAVRLSASLPSKKTSKNQRRPAA